jgi:hypothetical protein
MQNKLPSYTTSTLALVDYDNDDASEIVKSRNHCGHIGLIPETMN